ncbi:MAG: hypothetical protein JNK48_31965, partial [Bryobacterales bacterium]|nr:hypothetical protein [Bryobacterales bacterium]
MKAAFLLAFTLLQANAQSIPGFTIAPTTLNLSPVHTNQTVAIIPQDQQQTFNFTASASDQWITVLPPSATNVAGAQALLIGTSPFGPPSGGNASGTVRLTIGAASVDIAVTFTQGAPGITTHTISPLTVNVPPDATSANKYSVTITPATMNTEYLSIATISPSGASWLQAESLLGFGPGTHTRTFSVRPERAAAGVVNTKTL